MKKAVVLLPTYNEKDNIGKFIKEIFSQQKNISNWKIEVLVVDSNSPDGTLNVVKSLAQKNPLIHYLTVGRGLGVALIKGHQYSISHLKPDALIQLDADGQVDAGIIVSMLETLDQGYNFVIGSRFVEGGKNLLSFSRKTFTLGSSIFCRIVMGPFDIKEFSNSARAFTPELFKKIDLSLIPWRENTFISQPSFLNAAIIAGAKYKEVPLTFKDRSVGYSKMKITNYIYDVIVYAFEARLRKIGINFPLFRISRKGPLFIRFAVVGLAGTFVDFLFYKVFINAFHLSPPVAKIFSTEFGIMNNFVFNNFWTFKGRNTDTHIIKRLGIYNLVSMGGLLIGVGIIALLHQLYGDGFITLLGHRIAYNNFYFFATIPVVMIWNFIVNQKITWKHSPNLSTQQAK